MTWVKIDDAMHMNEKVRSVSLAARWAYVASICRSGATQSNGEIRGSDLGLIDANPKIAKELVEANLWETTSRNSYVVHDYLVYNRSREQIEALSRTNSANGAANRSANRSANRPEKTRENGSDSEPQNARSATSASPLISKPTSSVVDTKEEQKQPNDSLSESLSERDEAVGRLCRVWESATGTTVTRIVGDRIDANLETLPEEAVAKAITETGLNGAKAWSYTQTICDRYRRDGWRDEPQADATQKFRNDPIAAAGAAWRAKQ